MACYAAGFRNSRRRTANQIKHLDRVFVLEYLLGFVLSFSRTARDGVLYFNLPDRRHRQGWVSVRGRLAHLPWGVVKELATVHPLYFLLGSGIDEDDDNGDSQTEQAALAFLALRRSQEFSWTQTAADLCVYEWTTGVVRDLRQDMCPTRDNDAVWQRPVTVGENIPFTSRTTLDDARRAVRRFRELTEGPYNAYGDTHRPQVCAEVTRVLNSEGLGIETDALTTFRQAQVGVSREIKTWPVPKASLTHEIRARLLAHSAYVQTLPVVARDGGLSEVHFGQNCSHPDGIEVDPEWVDPTDEESDEVGSPAPLESLNPLDMPDDEVPGWMPSSEEYEEVGNAIDVFQDSLRRLGRTGPGTLAHLLREASTVAFNNTNLVNERAVTERQLREANEGRRAGAAAHAAALAALRAELATQTEGREEAASRSRDLATALASLQTSPQVTALQPTIERLMRERDEARAATAEVQTQLTEVRGALETAEASGSRTDTAEVQRLRHTVSSERAARSAANLQSQRARAEASQARLRVSTVSTSAAARVVQLQTELCSAIETMVADASTDIQRLGANESSTAGDSPTGKRSRSEFES